MTQPIRVWVLFVLEHLQVPYEVKSIRFDDVKKKPLTDINPNGRVPVIEDPNTGLTLWESGAIITYIIKQYDTKNLLTYTSFPEEHLLNQWLHFQMSGQGPYYGAAGWFIHLHPEKIPSAIDRYTKQVLRVLGVLEGYLEGKQWLVGDKMTYADMAWVPWNDRVDTSLGVPEPNKFDGFPNVKAWHERMTSLPSWKKIMETRAVLMDEQGLMWNGMPKGTKNFQEYEAKIKAESAAEAQ
ncbi:glutathione S-transferase [Annulohypoxylon truncatum]|uniref:glutathione S-transferase n=1 Tax=Annulohypoxylon truncatum TaxID=327061 RepID=UPI002007945A|nr:glutathione S-transferase [Annulohypoxylon truncatum]KAI1209077.1 glutathione S-transferase [Annulohypoxylon truncatum]